MSYPRTFVFLGVLGVLFVVASAIPAAVAWALVILLLSAILVLLVPGHRPHR